MLTWLTNKTSYTFTKPLWNGASYLYAMGTTDATGLYECIWVK